MLNALLYLRAMSARNWLVSRLKRLRQPKYLIGAIVGCSYFYFFFIHSFGSARPARPMDAQALQAFELARAQLPADWLPATTALGALLLLFILACVWLVPTERAALGFSEAEIAFLFPAPISRPALVHFRLLSTQLRSLAGALVMTLLTNRAPILGGNIATQALGWWLVFSTLSLHFSGARFTLSRLADRGAVPWRRRAAIGAALVAVLVIAAIRMPEGAAPRASDGMRPAVDAAVAFASTAPLSWLLWPIKAVLAPFLSLDFRGFAVAIGPALGLVAIHYFWVVRSAVAFEDAAVDQAAQRAARIAAWRAGRSAGASGAARPGPFPLATTGWPEIAFLWKNLLSTWPYFTPRIWLGCAAAAALAAWWVANSETLDAAAGELAMTVVIVAAYVLVVGPQFARQDIRGDLAHADILKTYPLPGWRILLGELLTPAAILTGVLWLLLIAVSILLWPDAEAGGKTGGLAHLVGTLGIAAVIPPLAVVQLLVPNGAALLFPSWFQATRTRGGGPEVVGQRMIFFFAQLLAMAAALLPAAATGAAAVLALHWLVGVSAALVVATVAVLAVLAAEVWCGVWWLGRRFERLDLSAEQRA